MDACLDRWTALERGQVSSDDRPARGTSGRRDDEVVRSPWFASDAHRGQEISVHPGHVHVVLQDRDRGEHLLDKGPPGLLRSGDFHLKVLQWATASRESPVVPYVPAATSRAEHRRKPAEEPASLSDRPHSLTGPAPSDMPFLGARGQYFLAISRPVGPVVDGRLLVRP